MPRIVSNVQDMQIEQKRELRQMMNRLWQDIQRQREAEMAAIEAAFLELQRQQNSNSSLPAIEE